MLAAVLVFLSYAHQDSAAALEIREHLEARGCTVRLDVDLGAGADWTRGVERMIDRSQIVVVLLNGKASLAQRAEYSRALRRNKRVIPVLLTPNADVPLPLETLRRVKPNELAEAAGCRK